MHRAGKHEQARPARPQFLISRESAGTWPLSLIQDRDGMPDFLVPPFLKSQQQDGVAPYILERHEIESYLLEPSLFERAARLVGRDVTADQAATAMCQAAKSKKATARRLSLETARKINRHLEGSEHWEDAELQEKVYEWFDNLDIESLTVVRQVFPGREILQETLSIINSDAGKPITRGQLVASIVSDVISQEMRDLLLRAGEVTNTPRNQASTISGTQIPLPVQSASTSG